MVANIGSLRAERSDQMSSLKGDCCSRPNGQEAPIGPFQTVDSKGPIISASSISSAIDDADR